MARRLGSSRRHNRKTGRSSVIKTARVGVQTSLALSSRLLDIPFFSFSPFLPLSGERERERSATLPSLSSPPPLYETTRTKQTKY